MNIATKYAPENKKEKISSVIHKIKNDFMVLPITQNCAAMFGKVKRRYKVKTGISRENIKKANIDLIIASTAIINSCVVVSCDGLFQEISDIFEGFQTKKI